MNQSASDSPCHPRISNIPPSYLKKKEKDYKKPSPGILNVLLRNHAFCEHEELKDKYGVEILKRLDAWNSLNPLVQEKIRPEIMRYFNYFILAHRYKKPELNNIIEKILDLATKAEFELGIMVDVKVKNDQEAKEYDSLLQTLNNCRDRIKQILDVEINFPKVK
jgi:hypothetical protein